MAAKQPIKLEALERSPAADPESAQRTGEDAHVVILRSGAGYYGIDISIVQEIVLMQEITPVPASAVHIAGMANLRGQVIPMAEFAMLIGQQPSERSDDTRILVVEHGDGHIGFIVDAVTEVMLVDGEKIEDAASVGAQEHDFIVSVAKLDDYLVSLVDVERLMAAAARRAAAAGQVA